MKLQKIKRKIDYKNFIHIQTLTTYNAEENTVKLHLYLYDRTLECKFVYTLPNRYYTYDLFKYSLIYNLPKRKLLKCGGYNATN